MKIKKILSLALAAVTTLSLAVPAYAATSNSTKITGTYKEVTLDVTVPTTGAVTINPYALDVALDDTSKISGMQIVTAPLAIINHSEMDLKVNATVTGEVKGNFKFATETTAAVEADPDNDIAGKEAATTNTGFVYFEMYETELKEANLEADATKAVCGLKAADINAAAAAWDKGSYDPTADPQKKIVVGTKAATGENLATLAAAEKNDTSGKVEVAEGGIALFRLNGDCAKSPKTPWAKADGFAVTVAFSFDV